MKEEKNVFSLPTLLLVTGFCFLSFAVGLKILDGVNTRFFLRFGFITFMAGILTGVFMLIEKKAEQGQNPEP